MRTTQWSLGLVVGLVVLCDAHTALAWCVERTCEDQQCAAGTQNCHTCMRDAQNCINEGEPLTYPSACLSFAVEAGSGAAFGVSDQDYEDVILEAFDRWRYVDCGSGSHPTFAVQSAGIVASHGDFFCKAEPDLNMSVWRSAEVCDGSNSQTCWQHESSSLGYTSSTFKPSTGVVYDADVELNVTRVLELIVNRAQTRDVLLSIATHEAGHFLGIAHSNHKDAIMAVTYGENDLVGRDFTQDDIDAVCALYPPQEQLLSCATPAVSDAALSEAACQNDAASPDTTQSPSCSVGPSPGRNGNRNGSGFMALLAVAGAWLVDRRMRVRRA